MSSFLRRPAPARPRVSSTVAKRGVKKPLPAYVTPLSADMAVVIPFFNPTQSIRMVQNILLCTQLLRTAAIPVYIVELATKSTPFVFSASPTVYQYRSDSYMFYKENLFAAAERLIPASYTKFVLLDSDILFDAADWYDRVSAALDGMDVVQPYEVAHYLGADFSVLESKRSIYSPGVVGFVPHPGFAWAFRRDWFIAGGGLFEHALIGGGDWLFQLRAEGKPLPKDRHWSYALDFNDRPSTSARLGYVDLTIHHLFHGPKEKRQYMTREEVLWSYLKSRRIDRISALVERRDDGIFEWIPSHREELNALLLTYFQGRDDDGV
jgi:hypothetical protein